MWLIHVQLFLTSWTVACQAPLSMGFSRQKYWSVKTGITIINKIMLISLENGKRTVNREEF